MSLALKLQKLRAKAKKSLQEVADEVGASKAHIWELEVGKSMNPSIELLTNLARCFKVSISDLVGENPSDEDAAPEVIAMYRDLKELEPEDLETMRIMMERLRKKKE